SPERVQLRRDAGNRVALEPVLLATGVSDTYQGAGGFRPGDRAGPGRKDRHPGFGERPGRIGSKAILSAIGGRLGGRPRLAQRPNPSLPTEPVPGLDLDGGRSLRPAHRPGRTGPPPSTPRRGRTGRFLAPPVHAE